MLYVGLSAWSIDRAVDGELQAMCLESPAPQEVLREGDKRLGFCAEGQREILNGFS